MVFRCDTQAVLKNTVYFFLTQKILPEGFSIVKIKFYIPIAYVTYQLHSAPASLFCFFFLFFFWFVCFLFCFFFQQKSTKIL